MDARDKLLMRIAECIGIMLSADRDSSPEVCNRGNRLLTDARLDFIQFVEFGKDK